MIMMGLIQCCVQAGAYFDHPHAEVLVSLLFVSAFSEAVNDVVCDGLMVV
jgi:hypothetical protein